MKERSSKQLSVLANFEVFFKALQFRSVSWVLLDTYPGIS